MEKKPKITIVIASYNSGKTIERALKSVENQVFKDWECLVIDGASKDDTVAIADNFAARDSRFHVYSEPDKGVYDAFNKGWRTARGEFVYYLGSDDELLPEGLQALAEHTDGADYVYGGSVLRYASGKTKARSAKVIEEVAPFSSGACHQGVIMRRSLIEKLGGFDMRYKIIADFDLIMRAYYAKMRTCRVDAMVAIFGIGGLSTDNHDALREKNAILKSLGVGKRKRYYLFVKQYIKICLLKIKHRFD